MKIAVTGKLRDDVRHLEKKLVREGFTLSSKTPDVVISLGGDGSVLYAERKYPSIPKVMVRSRSLCRRCEEITLEKPFHEIVKLKLKKFSKVEAIFRSGKKIVRKTAANDIVIRNRKPYEALRFTTTINRKKKSVIGDGIVAATAFGSTGYFHSITRRSFDKGIGIAFNNPIVAISPIIGSPVVRITIERHEAELSADNDSAVLILRPGDSVTIRKSRQDFLLLGRR